MPELRGFVRDNVMDILYYSSAVNSQRIVDAISTQLNAKHATPPYRATPLPCDLDAAQCQARRRRRARLQPHALEAATPCTRGCNAVYRRLQP